MSGKPEEPFFKKWIADNKDWADKNEIRWISRFYGGYAVAVRKRCVGFTPEYTVIKGEQNPELPEKPGFDIDYSVNMAEKDGYGNETERFINGSRYFAYDFCCSGDKADGLFKDTDFLKAFGGKTAIIGTVKGLHLCGVFAYDGALVYSQAARSDTYHHNFFTNARYIPFGNYVAVYNNKAAIPEKNFFPYNIVKPDTGEIIAENAALPYDDTENTFLAFYGSWMFYVVPYDERIVNYTAVLGINENHVCDWAKKYVKILLPECGTFVSCDNFSCAEPLDNYGVLVLKYKTVSDFTLINRYGIEIKFTHPGFQDREYDDLYMNVFRICRKKYIFIRFDAEEDYSSYEVFEEKSAINGDNPDVSYLCDIRLLDFYFNFEEVQYNDRVYMAYTDNEHNVCVIDDDFGVINRFEDASEPCLFTGGGRLYCAYKMYYDYYDWLYIHDLKTGEIIAKIPDPQLEYKIVKAVTVNGNLLFGTDNNCYYTTKIKLKGVDKLQKDCGSGFLEEEEFEDASAHTELLKKLENLPGTNGVYYNSDERERGYFLVDFNTGEAEKITGEELIGRFGG